MIKTLKDILKERTSPFDVFDYYYATPGATERLIEGISSKFLPLCLIYIRDTPFARPLKHDWWVPIVSSSVINNWILIRCVTP
jgi:hypothetical protein